MKLILLFAIVAVVGCTDKAEPRESSAHNDSTEQAELAESSQLKHYNKENLIAILDTIRRSEQEPLRLRDSLGRVHGIESPEAQEQQVIAHQNHAINIKKVVAILNEMGWLGEDVIGESGSLAICNVIQHADYETRLSYIPVMKTAVKEGKLQARWLARAEDRLATDQGELQIYGGQIKYYPETKTFNVWPIVDPENVDQRRAEIGLGPIAEFLGGPRFELEWNVEEQLKRTAKFLQDKESEVAKQK